MAAASGWLGCVLLVYLTFNAARSWMVAGAPALNAVAVLAIVLAAVAAASSPPGGERLSRRSLVALSLVFLATRGLWLAIAPTLPTSDFANYHRWAVYFATGELGAIDKAREVTSLGYPLFLAPLYAWLGADVAVAKATNLALGVASLWLIAGLGSEVAGAAVGLLAALLFLAWPAQLFFTSVLASEHLGLTLLLAALLSFARAERRDGETWRWLLTGALFGFACAARTALAIAPVICVAYLLVLSMRPRGRRWRQALLLCAAAGTCVLGFVAVLDLGFDVRPRTSLWMTALTGTNPSAGGFWNAEDASRFNSFASIDEANRDARREVWRRFRSQPRTTAKLFAGKIGSTWRDESYAGYWSTLEQSPGERADALRRALPALYRASQVWFLAVLLLAALGAARLAAMRGPPLLFALLFLIVAGTLQHAVLESQPRYHFMLVPGVVLLAGFAARCAALSLSAVRRRGAARLA